jgi:hypothetical protein
LNEFLISIEDKGGSLFTSFWVRDCKSTNVNLNESYYDAKKANMTHFMSSLPIGWNFCTFELISHNQILRKKKKTNKRHSMEFIKWNAISIILLLHIAADVLIKN